MAGKSPRTSYSESRELVERLPHGRTRIRRGLLPGLIAYALMVGARYRRALAAQPGDARLSAVPGYDESQRHLRWAVALLDDFAKRLPQTFDSREWVDAVSHVNGVLGIEDGDPPLSHEEVSAAAGSED